MDSLDTERIRVIKLALSSGSDVSDKVFDSNKIAILDDMAKEYGKATFAELSPAQQEEVLREYEARVLTEANNIVRNIVYSSNSKKMRKEAQTSWWHQLRYGEILSDSDKEKIYEKVRDIFASRRSWPRGHLINNEQTEELLIEEFMKRLYNMAPLSDPYDIYDNDVLHVCVATFLRNYPHLQTQYSNTFIPLQKTRENESEHQQEMEPHPFFSNALKEKIAKHGGVVVYSQKLESNKLEEGDEILVKGDIFDRNDHPVSAGIYVLVDPPIEGDGTLVLPIVHRELIDEYKPDDVLFVEFPDDDIEILD